MASLLFLGRLTDENIQNLRFPCLIILFLSLQQALPRLPATVYQGDNGQEGLIDQSRSAGRKRMKSC